MRAEEARPRGARERWRGGAAGRRILAPRGIPERAEAIERRAVLGEARLRIGARIEVRVHRDGRGAVRAGDQPKDLLHPHDPRGALAPLRGHLRHQACERRERPWARGERSRTQSTLRSIEWQVLLGRLRLAPEHVAGHEQEGHFVDHGQRVQGQAALLGHRWLRCADEHGRVRGRRLEERAKNKKDSLRVSVGVRRRHAQVLLDHVEGALRAERLQGVDRADQRPRIEVIAVEAGHRGEQRHEPPQLGLGHARDRRPGAAAHQEHMALSIERDRSQGGERAVSIGAEAPELTDDRRRLELRIGARHDVLGRAGDRADLVLRHALADSSEGLLEAGAIARLGVNGQGEEQEREDQAHRDSVRRVGHEPADPSTRARIGSTGVQHGGTPPHARVGTLVKEQRGGRVGGSTRARPRSSRSSAGCHFRSPRLPVQLSL